MSRLVGLEKCVNGMRIRFERLKNEAQDLHRLYDNALYLDKAGVDYMEDF